MCSIKQTPSEPGAKAADIDALSADARAPEHARHQLRPMPIVEKLVAPGRHIALPARNVARTTALRQSACKSRNHVAAYIGSLSVYMASQQHLAFHHTRNRCDAMCVCKCVLCVFQLHTLHISCVSVCAVWSDKHAYTHIRIVMYKMDRSRLARELLHAS